MIVVPLVFLVLAWYTVGTLGFIYWWTNEYDLTQASLFFAVLCGGTLGPFAWLVGLLIHGNKDHVIVKKRK